MGVNEENSGERCQHTQLGDITSVDVNHSLIKYDTTIIFIIIGKTLPIGINSLIKSNLSTNFVEKI